MRGLVEIRIDVVGYLGSANGGVDPGFSEMGMVINARHH